VTVIAPTSSPSPLASAQSLRQRHSRLSPLRLGIYGLVSLGSHLLLLGLFRWAWQVQLGSQPVGEPIGIDFVEVDLSDRAFADQLPDESATPSASDGRLSATQLNELIAQGQTAQEGLAQEAVPQAEAAPVLDDSTLAVNGVPEDNRSVDRDRDAAESLALPQNSQLLPNNSSAEQPRSWFPFGRPGGNREGLFGGERSPSPSNAPADAAGSNSMSSASTGSSSTNPNSVETDSSAASSPSSAQRPNEGPSFETGTETAAEAEASSTDASAPLSGGVEDAASAPSSESTADATPPASSATPTSSAPGVSGSSESEAEGNGETGGSSSSGKPASRPNPLPPNMSERPVSPDQSVRPDEAIATPEEAVSNNSSASSGSETGSSGAGTDNTGGNISGGSGSGNSAETETNIADVSDPSNPPNDSGDSNAPPRLGASLVVDEVQSRALNTRDVFTRLPQPIGDPLSKGGQSTGSGRCAAQLAALPPASYGQPIQLRLAVDPAGEVFWVEGIGAQGQTPLGEAVVCIAKEWGFEPAQRVLTEGGVEKVENAGAELFVTVMISLRE